MPMKRRKVLVGLGSLAAGGAATMGTGAFSNIRADRGLDVGVRKDDSAYLQLTEGQENGAYAFGAGSGSNQNQLELDFNGQATVDSGSGVNTDSEFRADDVFRVKNGGTQGVYLTGVVGTGGTIGNNPEIRGWIYPLEMRSTNLEPWANSLAIEPGENAEIGVAFNIPAAEPPGDTPDNYTGEADRLTLFAEEHNPSGATVHDWTTL